MSKQTYRLGSSPLVHAPGVVNWAVYHYKGAPETMLKVIRDGWSIPEDAAKALLSGDVKPTIEDDVVVFEA